MSANEYLLGDRDEELARLAFQHRVWARQAYALWERAGFAPGQTLLDAGCGPGFAAVELATLVGPAGRVIAVDDSQRFLNHLEGLGRVLGRDNIQTLRADVQRLELPPGSLDGAYARWLLCFLPRPEDAVAAIARALRPGGVFAVSDYFHYPGIALAPDGPALRRVAQAVEESWRIRGGDLDVAGRVPGMMRRCGLRVRDVRPIVRVARPGSALWNWPTTFFSGYVPKLVEMGLLTRQEQADFEREWAERSRDPDAFFSTPPIYDIIAEKPSLRG